MGTASLWHTMYNQDAGHPFQDVYHVYLGTGKQAHGKVCSHPQSALWYFSSVWYFPEHRLFRVNEMNQPKVAQVVLVARSLHF